MTFWCEPLQDVVIAEEELEEVSKGGIILATDESKKTRIALALAVGPGKWHDGVFVPTVLKPGDRFVFGKYQSAGEPITYEGKEYLLFREGDIVGKATAPRPSLKAVA
jgi:chaperonin GroES